MQCGTTVSGACRHLACATAMGMLRPSVMPPIRGRNAELLLHGATAGDVAIGVPMIVASVT